ncbi:major facilitator superfamily domain-containing protein [Lasiosphaeria hispida]|uniref:Major facilitator superfamily domain-containing protein n=1 Tax=Lasiosphaeria hispida TaxID=260671 RepID=A0AAJ0MDY6_9PEZI|nr:major facilitator superfamily domain-containing protein [Lasiosphaeria hispida]
MSTVLTRSGNAAAEKRERDADGKLDPDASTTSVNSIPPLGVAVEEKRFWFQRGGKTSYDPDAIATLPSVYDDPETAEKYQPRSDWENLSRFDPLARWTWGEEYKLVRKIDFRIMVWACIMFMALELDRANIGQALTDNFLTDLGMITNDYNLGNTVFKLSFLCAELPSQLVSKWVGPDRWIPAQMVLWSIVASAQFWLNGRTSFLVCRSLLGILQGGFIPDIILYLSYFYKHHELSLRLGFFWTAMSIADILSALLAYGLLHMRGVQGHSGWRWLFLVEGLLTLVIGIFAFALMPAGPVQTKSWFRGQKGWFNEREEKIIVNRVLREDPSKGDMHNRQPITPRLLWQSLKDFDLWPLYILGLVFQIPMGPPAQYLTLTLRNLGFDTFQTNLLAIPYTVVHIITMLILSYVAEIFNELTLISVTGQIWTLPFLIYLNVVNTSQVNRWVLYAVTTLLLGYPNPHPIQVGWNSRNANTVRSRTVSAACYNMFVQASGIISSNIYRTDDAPLYKRGNKVLLGIVCMNIVLYGFVKAYYIGRNKYRDKKWNAMTVEERLTYLSTTTDKGNKRLDFRFAH